MFGTFGTFGTVRDTFDRRGVILMSAADLLQRLRLEGFGLTVNGNCLIVTPGSELTDARRALIRQHKLELLVLLTEWPSEAQGEDEPARTCANCQHRLKPGTCAEPIVAGLLTEERGYGIAWPEPAHAATCPAWAARSTS